MDNKKIEIKFLGGKALWKVMIIKNMAKKMYLLKKSKVKSLLNLM